MINSGKLPMGWVSAKIGELAMSINPGFPSGKHNREGKGVPHIRPMNISPKGEIDLTVLKYVEDNDHDILLKDDILFNNTNSPDWLGKSAYIKHDTNWAYSNHMTRIRVAREYVDSAWITYCLHTLFLEGYFQANCVHHVNQASIGTGFLTEKVAIPLPPLPEQHRIVARIEELFSRLDAGVEALNKIKLQLKRYRQAVLKAAFEGKLTAEWRQAHKGELEPASVLLEKIKTERAKNGKYRELPPLDASDLPELPEGWVWARVGGIGQIETGTTPPKSNPEYYGEEYAFYKPTDLNAGYYVREAQDGLSALGIKKARPLPQNSVLVTCIGATIGKTGFIRREGACNQQINAVIPDMGVLPQYVYFACISPHFQKGILDRASSTTLPILNKGRFEVLPLPMPSFEEQCQIAKEIERHFSVADEIEKTIEQSLKQSERLRQSILKKAFEGKLVPQDPDDEPAEKLLERIKAEKAALNKAKGNGRKS